VSQPKPFRAQGSDGKPPPPPQVGGGGVVMETDMEYMRQSSEHSVACVEDLCIVVYLVTFWLFDAQMVLCVCVCICVYVCVCVCMYVYVCVYSVRSLQ
jgi:uncharacterized membrane protein (GlpM family)